MLGALVALLWIPVPAHAADTVVLAGPGSFATTYATPAIAVDRGGSLTFVNLEFEKHDVVQDVEADEASGPTDEPWCSLAQFSGGPCPLFWSEQIRVFQRTTPVLGIDNLEPGRTYSFYCTVHTSMTGKLVVLPQA